MWDNIFVYQPLPHVKSMYYLDVNFYRYFIGRDDQSVNEKVMIGRIDQQILVTKLMLGYYDVTKIKNPKLRHYMVRYLEIMMTVTSILAIRSETEENLKKKKRTVAVSETAELHVIYAPALGVPRTGRKPAGKRRTEGVDRRYKISQKFYGFNQKSIIKIEIIWIRKRNQIYHKSEIKRSDRLESRVFPDGRIF